jgi:hypothetical protein
MLPENLFGLFHYWLDFDTWFMTSFATTSYVYFLRTIIAPQD